jgi:hypothetical protein
MRWSELKNSKFLKKEDVDPAVVVTIAGFEKVNVAMEGAEPDYKYAMHLKELEKPLIMNQTNGMILADITRSEESEDSVGLKVELYNDPNIMYGGKRVGGVRIREVAKTGKKPAAAQDPQKGVDELMEYNSLPKPSVAEQGYLKSICSAAFGDTKCEIKNRLTIWNYIGEKRWPASIQEADSVASQLKLANLAGDDEIPF